MPGEQQQQQQGAGKGPMLRRPPVYEDDGMPDLTVAEVRLDELHTKIDQLTAAVSALQEQNAAVVRALQGQQAQRGDVVDGAETLGTDIQEGDSS